MPPAPTSMRVDVWLWAVRVFKTRSAATEACRAGHVRIDDERAKAAAPVRVGDTVRVRVAGFDRVLEVAGLLQKRGSAQVAAEHVVDRSPPRPKAGETGVYAVRDRGAGRPTKRERRDLDRLRGR
ncbi:ribosome-associated heat shock protein Hsp15 [Pseudoclavibacter chungangensis]|nr:ribosome-associated heat shock protein Hsp15 [Pseudoclavibacter chungangensis]